VRAPNSGILRASVGLGDSVATGQVLGVVGDPFGDSEAPMVAPFGGIVIGQNQAPLVHEGDASFNIARVRRAGEAAARIEAITGDLDEADLRKPDDPPVI
jgi:predicted deacylase